MPSKNFQALIIEVLTQHGEFMRLKGAIMVFWRIEPATMIVAHGDDFLAAGSLAPLESVNHPCIEARQHGGDTDTGKYLMRLIS